ncbi:tyrosine-protein phosphatase [Streptomyces sp. NPDC058770]|uniref:tyrosine-protein phosphatase n=1 Tax=Streptomyces sp. NPDC058770 TaxID=3346631 RepID=UPI0036A58A47
MTSIDEPMTESGRTREWGRKVPLGVRNFRDAGGMGALSTGVLFRSAALHALAPEDEGALRRLGLRTIVDLRSDPEVAERPDAVEVVRGGYARYLHVPVFEERRWPADQSELYPLMAERAGRAVVAVVRRLLAGDGAPVLVHCASGKDRTGVVVAVVQTLMGASEEDVLQDFLRSNTELGLVAGPPAAGVTVAHGSLPVAAAHLERAMLWIRSHHGSVHRYLVAHGLGDSELSAVRSLPGPTASCRTGRARSSTCRSR